MAGYTRQSTFADGDTITAALFNNEYNQLVNAFSNTTGHSHDGTAASGPVIGLIGDAGETSPNNKVLIDTTNNYIEFYVEVSSAPVQQLYIADGAIIPVTDSDIDLGTTSLRFKDTYTDTITTTGNATIGGNLTVTGNATISGNLTFGDADTDSINLAAEIDSHIVPNTDDTYDLGSSTKEWRNLYIDGTANIDSLVADTADINGGTIDGATIATSDITVGAGKTLNVSAGTLTLADNQISGDKVEGGTIAATTITTLTSTTGNITNVNATTVDSTNLEVTNLKAKDGTSAGSIADSTGVVTLTSSVLTTTDINGGTIDGVTIGGSSAGAVTFTDLSDGTITIAGFADEDNMVSNSATLLPTQQSVKAYVDSQVTAQDLDFQGDTGGALSIDLDSESLTIAGGTGIDTSGATNTLTVAIDSTVATLTGTQTLTNKTLTTPIISSISNTGTLTLPTSTDTLVGRATTDTLTNKTLTSPTLTSPVLNTGVSGTAFLDDDTFATASATTLASSESIKAYVDAQILTEDTLAELNDTNITSPADGALLFYDTGTSMWIDNVVSGDITIADTGVAAISSGVIVNDDINASAAISISKTALVDGTGLTLTGDTLSVDAAQTQITSVGTLGSLTVSGDVTVDTSTLKVDSTNNRVGILNATPDVSLDIGSATDAVHVPVGTTAQRPTGAAGYFRYNTSLSQFEGYTDSWGAIGGGGTNTFTHDVFTGDGTTTAFVLSQSTESENNLIVFIDGVFQEQSAYSIATAGGVTTLTMSEAPVSGRKLVVYTVAAGVSGSNLNIDTMTGDGSTTTLTLSINPVNENNTQVFFDGVYQAKSNYSVSGTTLTFTTAPPSGVAVEVMTFTQTDINVPVDGTITPAKIASGDFYFDTNTLYIDSTNNRVGIGTSPSYPLHVQIPSDGSVGASFRYIGGTNNPGLFFSTNESTRVSSIDASGSTTGILAFKTSGTEAMRIDTNGNVGIGTSSPNFKLENTTTADIGNNAEYTTTRYAFGRAATPCYITAFRESFSSTSSIVFHSNSNEGTSPSEKMRIDSSGRLLLGTTSFSTANNGILGHNDGRFYATSTSQAPLNLNRKTSDGDIAIFSKDGSTVGSIGAYSGSLFIGGGDVGFGFYQGADALVPFNPAANTRDAAIDLGMSSARYKDLYLSGGAYLGGTGAANKLDDYEEGTWTPACGATLSTATGHYTKIGNQVTVHYHVVTTGGLPSSTSQVQISGLPFTIDSNGAGAIYARYYTPNDSTLTTILIDGESVIRLINTNDQNFDYTIWGELEASANNSVDIRGTATYKV